MDQEDDSDYLDEDRQDGEDLAYKGHIQEYTENV